MGISRGILRNSNKLLGQQAGPLDQIQIENATKGTAIDRTTPYSYGRDGKVKDSANGQR